MTTSQRHEKPIVTTPTTGEGVPSGTSRAAGYSLGVLRLVIGWTFLWAFFDKLLALGYSTGRDLETDKVDYFSAAAWYQDGQPTYGFLKFGADGPFESFYHSIAGDAWADWLFMLGLLGIGAAFMLGIFTRIAAVSGVLMYLLMWSVALPPENNPIVDDHIIGAAAVAVLGMFAAGRYIGFGRWWERLSFVQKYPFLK